MMRRAYLPNLSTGRITLPPEEAHRVRNVLRLSVGDVIDLFDEQGRAATARIIETTSQGVMVQIDAVRAPGIPVIRWILAAAVPKGPRADWMIEKLAELGTARFVPLLTRRSVVRASGSSKLNRWRRLAAQAARQSGQTCPMHIEAPADLEEYLSGRSMTGFLLKPDPSVPSLADAVRGLIPTRPDPLHLMIGPEGGWTDGELLLMHRAGLTAARLGSTILRIETAAVVAAGIVAASAPSPAIHVAQTVPPDADP